VERKRTGRNKKKKKKGNYGADIKPEEITRKKSKTNGDYAVPFQMVMVK